jgi:peptide/nickel transport system permease protein
MIVQFGSFVARDATGDFGISYRLQQPVMRADPVRRLPATLELALISGLLAFSLGVGLGVYTALNRKGWLSGNAIMTVSLIGVSLPTFLIGVLLIWVFAVELQWLPSFGPWRDRGYRSLAHRISHAIGAGLDHPAGDHAGAVPDDADHAAGAIRNAGGAAHRLHQVRPRPRPAGTGVNFGHALKNTLVPVITITGLQLGSIIAFAIITESVFQWPGVGAAVHQGGAVRRHPGHGRLPDADRVRVRGHQPDRGYALLRRRSAPAG